MLRWLAAITLVFSLMSLSTPGHAVQPDEVLENPALEKRAREISLELRCLVCQNQSIDDSDAPLARDLRILVRDRLKQGDSDAEVIDFVVARYGEFVLLRPRFAPHTMALWLATPLLFLTGLFLLFRYFRQRPVVDAGRTGDKLTASEKRELNRILEKP